MAVRISTGFASAILGPNSFESLFQYGAIEIRSGAQPASADDAASGSLLGRITTDGAAWTAGSPTNGLVITRSGRMIRKNAPDDWILAGLATGTAGWFRWLPNTPDAGTASTTAVRIDGAIGLTDATGDYQLFLPTLSLTSSSSHTIADWWYSLPPLGA